MAFVKLDTGILDSTLWITRDPREVFITALLMAVPKEYEEAQPTWEVRSLDQTDFVVPPGWYGFVPASGPGIVRRAGVPLDDGLDALAVLGQPDPESRSSEWEGRRLVRVDGGFVVLNFMKYRDRDDTTAERSRRYRERKALLRATSATRDTPRVTPCSSPAEAEAEAELIPIPAGLRPATAPAPPDAGGVDLTEHQLNGHAPKTTPDCPHKEILALWAEVLPELPQHDPSLWTESARADNLRARWRATAKLKGWATKEDGIAYFARLFRWCRSSDFLMGRTTGRTGRPFRFELAWLVNATNWTKVHEGKFSE